MKKFKILLIIFLLPFTLVIYYFTSENHGISAYIDKKKSLDNINEKNKLIRKEISIYSSKIKLLKSDTPDKDLLNEKALDLLGITEKENLVVNIENL